MSTPEEKSRPVAKLGGSVERLTKETPASTGGRTTLSLFRSGGSTKHTGNGHRLHYSGNSENNLASVFGLYRAVSVWLKAESTHTESSRPPSTEQHRCASILSLLRTAASRRNQKPGWRSHRPKRERFDDRANNTIEQAILGDCVASLLRPTGLRPLACRLRWPGQAVGKHQERVGRLLWN
jgi:hypothetical protein